MSKALVSPDLLAGLRAGTPQAQEVLMREFVPRLIGLARLRGFSEADAEEIVQDTLAAAMTQLREGRFEGRSQLPTWVHAIFNRRAADHRRSNARWQAASVSLEALSEAGRAWADRLTSTTDTATILRVQDALARLLPEHRVVLLLNVHEGHPAKDIAYMFRQHRKTVEAKLTEAKKAFRQAYLEQLDGATEDSPDVTRLSR
jgi:RNA polymerase sigma factor (sigma-70 family)